MGLAALNPLLDGATEREVVVELSGLADRLAPCCAELRSSDDPAVLARLNRIRRALGHIASAATLLDEGGRTRIADGTPLPATNLPVPDARPPLEPTDTMNPRRVMTGPVLAPGYQHRSPRRSISEARDHPLGTSAMGSARP